MPVQLKPLSDQTIVITGASSGIGLATARAAAAQGANVVLASRDGEALAEIEGTIRDAGGSAIHVVADAGRRQDLQNVAEAAIGRFGGFDTWVNNAGITIWGRLEEVSEEDSRRLFETNFWGVVHGSLIAAKHLERHGGAIVNLGSVASDYALPLQGMYSASKHAVKGFTDALRMELEEKGAPVSVTLVKPASIDTPFPQHARKYTAREPKLPPPVYPAREAAAAILHAAAHPERDLYVGGAGRAMCFASAVAPRAMDRYAETSLMRQQVRDEPVRDPAGSLHRPAGNGRIEGGHPGYVTATSLYTRAAMHPALTAAAVAGCVALLALGRSAQRSTQRAA